MSARQQRFEMRVDRPLGELPFKADGLHLPGAAGLEAPATRLSPLLLLVRTTPPREGQKMD